MIRLPSAKVNVFEETGVPLFGVLNLSCLSYTAQNYFHIEPFGIVEIHIPDFINAQNSVKEMNITYTEVDIRDVAGKIKPSVLFS